MEELKFGHTSVLLYETVGSLNIIPGGCYVDGTLGGGGHALEVLKRLGHGRLIGIDQDADAIAAAGQRLKAFEDKMCIRDSCDLEELHLHFDSFCDTLSGYLIEQLGLSLIHI